MTDSQSHREIKTIERELKRAETQVKKYRDQVVKLKAEKEAAILAVAPDANLAISNLITAVLTIPKDVFASRSPDLFYTRTSDGGSLRMTVHYGPHDNWTKRRAGEKQVRVLVQGSFHRGAATCLKQPWHYHVQRTKTVKTQEEAEAAILKLITNCQKHLKDQLL